MLTPFPPALPPQSNYARFVNHSCDPNAELQRWKVDGYTRIGIFARRHIPAGTEVEYDYQFFTAQRTPCGCGAAKCRGFLGANVAKEEEKARLLAERESRGAAGKGTHSRKSGGGADARRRPKAAAAATAAAAASSTAPAGETALPDWPCKICGSSSDDASLLLCDGCDGGHHIYCLQPPLAAVPEGSWLCADCVASGIAPVDDEMAGADE